MKAQEEKPDGFKEKQKVGQTTVISGEKSPSWVGYTSLNDEGTISTSSPRTKGPDNVELYWSLELL